MENAASEAITEYLAALQEVYPTAKGTTRIVIRPDQRVIVSTRLPTRARERMDLFDQMAEIVTTLNRSYCFGTRKAGVDLLGNCLVHIKHMD